MPGDPAEPREVEDLREEVARLRQELVVAQGSDAQERAAVPSEAAADNGMVAEPEEASVAVTPTTESLLAELGLAAGDGGPTNGDG